MANCADWRIRVNLAVKMKVVGKKHSIADSLQFLRISRNQLTEVVEATFNWILQNFAAWWQNTQTLIGKVCLKSEPCYENIMNTLWKYYENVWKPSVYSLPWSDSPVARSYFITAEKPWKHISLNLRVYRFSCTQLWEKYNSKSMPRWCWKTRQKSSKISKKHQKSWD